MGGALLLVVIFLCSFHGYIKLFGVFADEILGAGEMNILYVRACDNPDDYPVKLFVRKGKLNRTHEMYDVNVTTEYDIDETVSVHVNVAKKGDGGYKPNFFITEEKYCCEYFRKFDKEEFKRIMDVFEQPTKCPIKAGEYAMYNHILKINNAASMLYGDFKADIIFKKGDMDIACLKAAAIVKPRSFLG